MIIYEILAKELKISVLGCDAGQSYVLKIRLRVRLHSLEIKLSIPVHRHIRVSLFDTFQLGYLPDDEVLLIATGSQGEPNTALAKLAAGTHRDIELNAGDTVIFSAKVIPGNEDDVALLVRRLRQRGILVIETKDSEYAIHASGHPCQQELQQLYQWVRPDLVIPVHGEPAHLRANVEVAKRAGIRRTLLGTNGDLFHLGRQIAVRRQITKTGRIVMAENKPPNRSAAQTSSKN